MTAPLEISKNVVGEDGKTDYDTSQQFTFAIALDFDGKGSTYDYKTYPLEYQLKENIQAQLTVHPWTVRSQSKRAKALSFSIFL